MIPIKLQLKNFLSYGSQLQTINFEPYNFICLSGKNGHGKSALLDAITWAVWGDARKISGSAKADEGLLRLGQNSMVVIFDFEFNEQVYRIRREYLHTYGKPIASLEFGIVNSQTTEFIPLTDKTIRETQKKIEQTLNLDFDTFSNSAFLRQGNANEFSKKSSKDRKQILATILGLDKYEVIRKLALEQTKQAITQKSALTAVQEKREQEIAAKTTIEAATKTLHEKLNALQQEETGWKENIKIFQNRQADLHEKQKLRTMLLFQQNQLVEQKLNQEEQLKYSFIQWREINKKRKLATTLTHLQEEKTKLLNAINNHQTLLAKNLEHKELLFKIKQDIYETEQRYQNAHMKEQQEKQLVYERMLNEEKIQLTTHHTLNQHLENYNAQILAICAEIATLAKTQTVTLFSHEQLLRQEQHLEKRKAAYQQFVALGNWLTKELHNLAQKKKLSHDDNDPSCPLCEQNLSATRRKFLKAKFLDQEHTITHRLSRLKKIIPQLKEILLQQHESITTAKEQKQRNELTHNKITDLNQAKNKIEAHVLAARTDSEKTAQTITTLTDAIAKQKELIVQNNNSFQLIQDTTYQTLLAKQKVVEKELGANIYDPIKHKSVQTDLAAIENKLTEFEQVKLELERQKERKEQISVLCLTLKSINNEEKKLHTKLSQLAHLEQEISVLSEQEVLLNQKERLIREQKDTLLHEKGSLENQERHINKIINEFEQEKQTINSLENTINEYQAIAAATGKDGIQALLIEDAIPEIEQEANHLLSKLTNNQATIFIESLRDLKKGGSKETLDINISDAAGIRPYELFSGGEAFRIDFALRIAISKLLARRAGTALQTLIIDEGFGSQDEEGLTHIMDALYKIQDDFSKIIVVSHLPAMKDQFPIHFVVEKGPQGSVVNVLEQG